MNWFGRFISRFFRGPLIRPLGLAGPIFVLLIALPLLRPLRHPSEAEISIDETLRLATVRALVEHRSLALDPHRFAAVPGTIVAVAGCFSAQPPMMALLLAPAAWGLVRFGFSFDANASMMSYLLTLIGSTLPVAAAAGLDLPDGADFSNCREPGGPGWASPPWRPAGCSATPPCSTRRPRRQCWCSAMPPA